tara:strand:+ start:209 stop:490 length:282 start_codon:yes stop_codon:yes gene_type:complete
MVLEFLLGATGSDFLDAVFESVFGWDAGAYPGLTLIFFFSWTTSALSSTFFSTFLPIYLVNFQRFFAINKSIHNIFIHNLRILIIQASKPKKI